MNKDGTYHRWYHCWCLQDLSCAHSQRTKKDDCGCCCCCFCWKEGEGWSDRTAPHRHRHLHALWAPGSLPRLLHAPPPHRRGRQTTWPLRSPCSARWTLERRRRRKKKSPPPWQRPPRPAGPVVVQQSPRHLPSLAAAFPDAAAGG
jgi:hypothetical protein